MNARAPTTPIATAASGRPMTRPRLGVDDPPLDAVDGEGEDDDVDDELVAAAPVGDGEFEVGDEFDWMAPRADAVLNEVEGVVEAVAELSLVVDAATGAVSTCTSLYVVPSLIKAICPFGYAGSDAISGKFDEPVTAVPALLSQGQLSEFVSCGSSPC